VGHEVLIVSAYPEILNEKLRRLPNVVGIIPYPEAHKYAGSDDLQRACAELKAAVQKVLSEKLSVIRPLRDKRELRFKSQVAVNAVVQTGKFENYVSSSPTNALTIVISVRNPRVISLERCIQSIRENEDEKSVEIIISDFGSEADYRQCLRQLAERYGARLIESDTRADWSRARALNIAIRECKTPWVLATDADMIFSPFLIPMWRTYCAEIGSNAIYLSQTKKIVPSKSQLKFPWNSSSFLEAAASARLCGTYAQGGFQCAPLEWLLRVHGFNEKFRIWGAEDEDLTYRANLDGLDTVWLPAGHLLHQWHAAFVPQESVLRNRKLFEESQILRESVVNGANWGSVSSSEIEDYRLRGPLRQEVTAERMARHELERRILEESTTDNERLQLLIAWGKYALDLGWDESAFETFSDALELAPTNVDARVGLSAAKLLKRDFSHASHDASVALEMDPGNEIARKVLEACQKIG
jgi:GT2 family glycosyltransferase